MEDLRINKEVNDAERNGSEFTLENIPTEICGVIASYLPFLQFMALFQSNRKFRNLLADNNLWACQIQRFFKTSTYNAKPKCQRTFKWIYSNRKKFEPAILAGFKSAYVHPRISDLSDDVKYAGAAPFGSSLKNVLLDDALFSYESKQSENVNIVLMTYNTVPNFIRSIKISSLKTTVREPLSAGLVFLFDEEPDLKKLEKFNSFTKQQWDDLTSKYDGTEALRNAGCPVTYFEDLENAPERAVFINFEFPFPVASFMVLKMLRGKANKSGHTGISVANLILYGAPADAYSTQLTWVSNQDPDDIDMGGLDSRGDEFD